MRRTKIICTLGPATGSREKIRELMDAGMDIARLNFSHGTQEQHATVARWVREASQELGRPVALLQDLSGPKIRTGRLRRRQAVRLTPGQTLGLTACDLEGSSRRVSVSYEQLAEDVRPGDSILLDDGLIELRVVRTVGREVETKVIHGGLLSEHKGVNLPGVRLSVEALTPKDQADLRFGVELGVDYIALSFVRRAVDVRRLKAVLRQQKADIPVLAKLEKPEAIANLDSILEVSDGVMVARGDLGVEMSPERVPLIQKKIIQRAAALQIPVITATQMLESMTVQPRPTRAEASDVANAVFDGTDALMLSAETASGHYPIEAVKMMARIAQQVEQSQKELVGPIRVRAVNIADTICESVVHATQRLHVKAVVAFTRSGSTARLLSKYRPERPIYAFCHEERIARRAALYWGVVPFVMPLTLDEEATLAQAQAELLRRKLVSHDDILAVVSGVPGKPGQTNLMKLVRVESR
ncbi:MAG: pyruvate kinase [Acidobacteria bacterium]|nr:pyruvate kinase [Acidobacteriota bacterium]